MVLPAKAHKNGLESIYNQLSGEETIISNITAASVIKDLIQSMTGPRGMKKILIEKSSKEFKLVNDGAAVLERIRLKNPAARIIIGVAEALDKEAGDGTVTAVILAATLLEQAETLIDMGLHPSVIIEGYRIAAEKAMQILDDCSASMVFDETFLANIVITTMGVMDVLTTLEREHLAKISIEAVKKVAKKTERGWEINIENIKIEEKEGASLLNSFVVDGVIVDYPMFHAFTPKRIENAKIAIIMHPITLSMSNYLGKGPSFVGIRFSKGDDISAFAYKKKYMIKEMAEKIVLSGANVVICNRDIDPHALSYFAEQGILACRMVLQDDIDKITKATGAEPVLFLENPSIKRGLGDAKCVFIERIGNKKHLFIQGCEGKSATIILRGASNLIMDKKRALLRSLHALKNVMEKQKVVVGGGAIESELAYQIGRYATEVEGREKIAINAFSEAMEHVILALAKNMGLNALDALIAVRAMHAKGEKSAGVSVGGVVRDTGVYEPKGMKIEVIRTAFEAVKAILRADGIVSWKGRRVKKPLEEEEIEELEKKLVPGIMEMTQPHTKFPWDSRHKLGSSDRVWKGGLK